MAAHPSVHTWETPWAEEPTVHGVEKSWPWLSTHAVLYCIERAPAVFCFSQDPRDCAGKETASGGGRVM